MPGLPKFVLQRLQGRVVSPESHPDADLLTAYAEHSLARRERAILMDHLAACADCRDVIALALPVAEVSPLPTARAAPRIGWLTWPMLRWAALSAGILVVVSAGILHYSHHNQVTIVASNFMQKDAASAPSVANQPLSPHATLPPTATRTEPSPASQALPAHKLALAFNQPRARAAFSGGSRPGMAVVGGAANTGEKAFPAATSVQASDKRIPSPTQARNSTPEIHQQVKVGAASTMVEVQSEATALNSETAATGQNQVAQNHADLPIQGREFTDLDVVKAKDPVPTQVGASPAAPQAGSGTTLQTASSVMVQAMPLWTVTPAGTLQRSLDSGGTWQTIDPSAPPRSSMAKAAASAQAGSGATSQKKEETRNQKVLVAPNQNSLFRAVAAYGPEIWAGASSGLLYHSFDGGNRWALVTPSDSGSILTGDIVSIQFSEPQHWKIATSTGELWTTSDSGQTWHKQP